MGEVPPKKGIGCGWACLPSEKGGSRPTRKRVTVRKSDKQTANPMLAALSDKDSTMVSTSMETRPDLARYVAELSGVGLTAPLWAMTLW